MSNLASWAALCFALWISPWTLVRLLVPRLGRMPSFALSGAGSVFLNAGVAVALHVARVPMTPLSLTIVHLPVGLTLLTALRALRRPFAPVPEPGDRLVLGVMVLFTLAAVPFTPLAGIDTYKWLDLAMAVRKEECVPWLVHAASLLGFTGRSYPSAQPLVLGTIQILGVPGVEASFYIVSLFAGWLGIASVAWLARAMFQGPAVAAWSALCYGFAPIFLRYNHWATGPGFFLALFPLYLLALARFPRPAAAAALLPAALALALSHKAGLVVAALLPLTLPLGWALPRRGGVVVRGAVVCLAALGFVAFSAGWPPTPSKLLDTTLRVATVRFGVLFPAAAVGLLLANGWFETAVSRRLLPAGVAALAFAGTHLTYGALPAAVFVSLAAARGLEWGIARVPDNARRAVCRTAAAVVLLGGLPILANRAIGAAPRRVRAAALFLDRHDPDGPFRIVAREWREHIQGYAAGCPRFNARAADETRLRIRRPPPVRGEPRERFSAWVAYLRHALSVEGTGADYYGRNPRVYHVRMDAVSRAVPAGLERIYQRDGLEILQPAGQRPSPTPPLAHARRAGPRSRATP